MIYWRRPIHRGAAGTGALLSLLLPAAVLAQIDITEAVLSSRSASCADYTGRYHSTVTDHINHRTIDGELNISADEDSCTFVLNQIPNHDIGQGAHWPHSPEKNTDTIRVPRTPTRAAALSWMTLGPTAIMLNGVKWEPNPAACFGEGRDNPGRERIGCGPQHRDHPWRYNVGSELNKFSFDSYHAHVQRGGMYHYHATPRVLYTQRAQLFDDEACSAAGPSPVIGFALDGYPLYGPCIADENGRVRAARSSYKLKSGARVAIDGYQTPYVTGIVASANYNGQFVGDYEYVPGAGDLDACNGATIDGQYGYYTTTEFPYAMRCLSGSALMPVR